MTAEGTTVELYIYDLTHGFASLLAPAIIGRAVEGVWHTGVVAYGREFFYGGGGITSCAPGGTQLGLPHRVEKLGETFVPFQVFVDYLQGLSTTTYTPSGYSLLEHNCNHFSDEVAQFLCGAQVPKHILTQPEELLNPQQRGAIQALLTNLVPEGAGPQMLYANGVRHARQDSPDYLTLNNQIEEARVQSQELEHRRSTLAEKLARKERKKEKKRKKQLRDGGREDAEGDDDVENDEQEMAEAVEAATGVEELSLAGPSAGAGVGASASASASAGAGAEPLELQLEADERRQEEQRKRDRDPPIVFKDIDGAAEFEQLAKALEGVELSGEERQSMEELQQYLVAGEGSWVLGDEFLTFVGRVLGVAGVAGGAGGAGAWAAGAAAGARAPLLRCLAALALRADAALVLHQDRRQHALLTYAHRIDRQPLPDQRALALFMCNLFEHTPAAEWLLYISEWEPAGAGEGQGEGAAAGAGTRAPLSNIRATTKVAVHAALSADAALREAGTALAHNLATKEVKTVVFDEVCVELAMALLQLLQWAPAEEHLFRACKALARLALHSPEVPQLVAMVGPDPAAFRGTSPRVDEQIDLIMKKIK